MMVWLGVWYMYEQWKNTCNKSSPRELFAVACADFRKESIPPQLTGNAWDGIGKWQSHTQWSVHRLSGNQAAPSISVFFYRKMSDIIFMAFSDAFVVTKMKPITNVLAVHFSVCLKGKTLEHFSMSNEQHHTHFSCLKVEHTVFQQTRLGNCY